jgi:para-nitrobenzyl esterase
MMSQQTFGVVQVENGLLEGIAGNDPSITVFKGVPYAAPPVGELRWQATQPPLAWEGLRKADQFGPICPQYEPKPGTFYADEFYPTQQAQSEDCLYLNIWTGAQSSQERRPVMVWIHGGAYIEGSGSLPSFDGETLAQKGVVLVTINYRLGVFGFFSHPALAANSPYGTSGNYGLLDQIAALRWVRDNIAAFGGDPSNVTIFGQSAGSRSVCLLQVSPLAKGLFKRAIAQSGSHYTFGIMPLSDYQTALKVGGERAENWGAQTAEGLRSLPVATLLGKDLIDYRGSNGYSFCKDGAIVPTNIGERLATGQVHTQAMLMGATSDEWTPNLVGLSLSPEQLQDYARSTFGDKADQFFELYPLEDEAAAPVVQTRSRIDQVLAGMRLWAAQQSSHGPNSVYLYFFNRALPGRNSEFYGAFHSGDLYYVFNTLASTARPWTDTDRRLADLMSSYWSNFAATGDPNGPGLPEWPAYQKASDQVMFLGDQVEAGTAPRQAQIALHTWAIEQNKGY